MYHKVESWFDIVALEHDMLKFWEEHDIFQKRVTQNMEGRPWSFLDGPITANNPMGVHHAWGRTLKDLYQRYWAMNGRKIRYQNGFDCQGLWVEVEVEKELGFQSKREIEQYGIDRFVKACKERVKKYASIMTEQSQRLGYWMEWENSYYTMSDENNYTIWGFLKKCHEKGLIYKGHDVMPWCPRCGTGISQHEMQEGYQETTHLALIVCFPLVNREKEALLVWTTTPWTLSSNVSVAVHPDLVYAKVKQADWYYYVLKSRAEKVLHSHVPWHVVDELTGSELVERNMGYTGPFDDLPVQHEAERHHTVLPWNEVTADEGTGIVHIAPGCGAEDFQLGQEFGLPAIAPIDEGGHFVEGFDWLTGKHASEVANEVQLVLQEKGLWYSGEQYTHSYGHCWRCGTELLFRLVDEWFIAMDPWREQIKNVARQIEWIPSFGLALELDWLSNMRDWMISKKRFWGLALPIWECRDCHEFTVIGSREELQEKAVEGWQEFAEHSPHRPWIDQVKVTCPTCQQPMTRVPDVGNPWLDAGIVAYSTVQYNTDREYWQQWVPADLILECFPGQYRHWFYSLIAMSTMMENVPPCKTILGHAPVYDEHGEEMHKSKGNAIWFDDAVETVGADVMRWLYCNQELSSPLNFGYAQAKFVRGRFFNTLWNSYAFFVNYARLSGFSPSRDGFSPSRDGFSPSRDGFSPSRDGFSPSRDGFSPSRDGFSPSRDGFSLSDAFSDVAQRPDFDRWILAKLQKLIWKCRASFEAYDVRSACRATEDFLESLSNWYIRNNRRRFWHAELTQDTRDAYETLFECLSTVLRLLAPVLPMLSEACYQNLVRAVLPHAPESVHLTVYPNVNATLLDDDLVEHMDAVARLHQLALSAREKSRLKLRQPLARLLIAPANTQEHQAVQRFAALLRDGLNVKQIEILDVGTACPVELRIKPNYRSLGHRFKENANTIAKALEEQQTQIVETLKQGVEQFVLDVQDETISLTFADILVEEVEPQSLALVRFDKGWLAFDVELTDELRQEGLMRDVLRQLQVLRKDVGLEIEDRIRVTYQTNSFALKEAIEAYRAFLCEELLCEQLAETSNVHGTHFSISGEAVVFSVEKV